MALNSTPSFVIGDGKLIRPFGASDSFDPGRVVQPDGKTLVAGTGLGGFDDDFVVRRYNPDGSLDQTFGSGGQVVISFGPASDQAYSVALQPDGKIVAAGSASTTVEEDFYRSDFALVRYNADGTLDPTFGSGGTVVTALGDFDNQGRSVAVQSDGKIVVAGYVYNGLDRDFALARYNADGSLDGTFGSGGKVVTAIGAADDYGYKVVVQADGKILVTGTAYNQDFAAARYNADGTLDLTFDGQNTLDGAPSYTEQGAAVVLDANVAIYDAELASSGNYNGASLTLVRHNGASPDDLFGASGNLSFVSVNAVLSGTTIGTVTKNSGGTLSLTFNSNATQAAVNETLRSITYRNPSDALPTSVQIDWSFSDGNGGGEQGTGGVLAVTGSSTVSFTALNDAPTFAIGDGYATTPIGASYDVGRSVALQTDGKIVVAGYSVISNFDSTFSVVRYNRDGSLDTTFGSSGKVTTDFSTSKEDGESVLIQPDGKIVVAGFSGNNSFALTRYTPDGVLDTTFGTGGKLTTNFGDQQRGASAAMQADGKIVVAGEGWNEFGVARYNSDGTLDATFGSGGTVTTTFGGSGYYGARSIVVQPDGKITVAGSIHNGSNSDFALVRYTSTGALDTTFGGTGKVITPIGSNFDYGKSVVVQPNGDIVLAGYTSYNGGTYDFALVRYFSNGQLDTYFGTGGKVTTSFGFHHDHGDSVFLQPDGKIVVAGDTNNSAFALARYNSNGTLDTTFGSGGKVVTNFSGDGNSAVMQPDGKIVVAGVSGSGDFGVARFNSDGSIDLTFDRNLNTLNGAPSFTENGAAVVLDADVSIYDAELSAAGNFNSATLTLARHNGASADDQFGGTGNLSALTQGGALVLSGVTIGTVTQNSSGTLILTFNANATEARVKEAMQSITYKNLSDSPSSSAQINWSFSDGNGGSQGTGGALAAAGSTTVSITAVNDAPSGANTTKTINEDSTYTFAAADFGFTDVEGNALTGVKITTLPGAGTLTLNNVVVTAGQVISLANINAGNLKFAPAANGNGANYASFTFQVQDNGGTSNGGVDLDQSANSFSFNVTAVTDANTHDFNGDGKSDVLWRQVQSGDVSEWLMNGLSVEQGAVVANGVPLAWAIKGTGDFNGDGKSDILWRNSQTGDVSEWLMNGLTVTQGEVVASAIPLEWKIQGTGDLNGDGKSDIVWRNDQTGDVSAWIMNGLAVTRGEVIAGGVPLEWQVQGTGDFNGDGKSDILWRNTQTGDVSAWLMNGLSVARGEVVASGIPLEWQIQGTGDFNGDGKSDILWRNAQTGDVSEWIMNGLSVTQGEVIATGVPLDWQVQDTGDYNADGKTDILWRHSQSGDVSEWLMNGLTVTQGAIVASGVPQEWVIFH